MYTALIAMGWPLYIFSLLTSYNKRFFFALDSLNNRHVTSLFIDIIDLIITSLYVDFKKGSLSTIVTEKKCT
jgi:hypothetical protein